MDIADSDSSNYESSEEEGQDDKSEAATESHSSSDTESSEDDNSKDGANEELVSAPTITVARVPRYRQPPPRPSRPHTAVFHSSPRTSVDALTRKGSLSSHLSTSTTPVPTNRQRSSSSSDAMLKPYLDAKVVLHDGLDKPFGPQEFPTKSLSQTSPNSTPWSSTAGFRVSHSLAEKERKRQEAIHELITTEQVYLSYLHLVQDDFQKPLLSQKLITLEESLCIFMDWSKLQELSQSIVDELMQRQGADGGVVLAVGDVINSHIVERASCFMRYCANHRNASTILMRKMTESQPLLDFLTQAKSKPSCRGLDLSSFLLQPLQRITRYPLLIKKILEYTDHDHIDHLLLSEALVSTEGFLDRINEAIRNSETKERLEDIQFKMATSDSSEGIVLTSETKYLGQRQLVHEGQLRKAKSGRKLYMYLCNDLLLLFIPGRVQGSLTRSASHSYLTHSTSIGSPQSHGSERNWGNNQGWALYQPPIPLERVKACVDPGDDLKFTLTVTTPASLSPASHVPAHLQSSQRHQPIRDSFQAFIHLKANSAKERRLWLSAIDKATETLARVPRDYGMRQSIRPPLSKTIGTMTIRVNEAGISSREFAKSKSFLCTISLGDQLFTTKPVSTTHSFTGTFSILWRESVIFAVTSLTEALTVKVLSSSPFSPDTIMGIVQVPFHTVIPFGERGTEVVVPLASGIEVKFFMSYKTL